MSTGNGQRATGNGEKGRRRPMLLELMLAVWAFSLPIDPFRARAHFPLWPRRPVHSLPAPRRAPLAEHGWEARVLCNLTSVE